MDYKFGNLDVGKPMSKGKRLYIDIAMVVLLPTLMAYSLIGETFHEVVGSIMFVLFIIHHYLNRGWIKGLFKGKYTPRRIFQTTINLLLLIFMILQPVSGILMSKHIFTSIKIAGASLAAREIHLVLAYWGFVLMSTHAGTHLVGLFNKKPIIITACIISIYGCYAFVKRQFPDYMFLRTSFAFFDYSEPRIFFFLDYIAIMLLFMTTGCIITKTLSKSASQNKNR